MYDVRWNCLNVIEKIWQKKIHHASQCVLFCLSVVVARATSLYLLSWSKWSIHHTVWERISTSIGNRNTHPMERYRSRRPSPIDAKSVIIFFWANLIGCSKECLSNEEGASASSVVLLILSLSIYNFYWGLSILTKLYQQSLLKTVMQRVQICSVCSQCRRWPNELKSNNLFKKKSGGWWFKGRTLKCLPPSKIWFFSESWGKQTWNYAGPFRSLPI